jgi:hypothetical protein
MIFSPPITSLFVFILVVWRLTHLLWGEDGPALIFVRLRRFFGSSFPGQVLDCFYCLSLWVAAHFAWLDGNNWAERGLLWLGFSGGAILLERITTRTSTRSYPPAMWHETPVDKNLAKSPPQKGDPNDVLLR